MKRRVLLFLGLAVLALMVGPVVNLSSGQQVQSTSEEMETPRWWSRANLYRLDFLMPWLGRLTYSLGISISPDQVIIGRDGWLYLGDKYARGISTKRHPATAEDHAVIDRIVRGSAAWRYWLEARGVRCYRIQVVPNKSSVYTEYLPRWAQSAPANPIDSMLEHVSPAIYVNTLSSLHEAKTRFSAPLYYRTDSHWNALGAWIGYRELARSIDSCGSEQIQWLTPDQIRRSTLKDQGGRDLASFLWLGDVLEDIEVVIDVDIGRSIPTVQVDFETGAHANLSGNPRIAAPTRPLWVRSPNALNQARVLWLRDSFGAAMAPFMAATFSETLQLNYGLQSPEEFASMVDRFKPDYVIVTGIERAALSDWFQSSPPD